MLLSRLICASALAGLCACQGAPADRPSAESSDILITDEPQQGAQRVTVNSREAAAPRPGDEDRIVITAMRSALRTGRLDVYLTALSRASCPADAPAATAEAIPLTATPVALQASNPARRKVNELTFVAAYQMTSNDRRFGGLSGLDLLDNGQLLAVSDRGWLVWIDLDREGLAPVSARIAPLRDLSGEPVQGAEAAAEGLAVNGGMALVSFEGEHRVLAYDLGKCGAAARGAPIVFDSYGLDLRDAFADANLKVGDSDGSEALAVTPDWYMFAGVEQKVGHLSPMSARPIEAEPEFNLRVGVDAPEFTGLDLAPLGGDGRVRAFLLHRSRDAADRTIAITETTMLRFIDNNIRTGEGEMGARARYRFSETGWRELGRLNLFETVDSFEGIAAKPLSDGRVRLYVVSDDDFAPDQRSVLMIFDAPRPLR